MQKVRVIPGEDREAIRGKGTHQRRVCGARESFRAADAARMDPLPLPSFAKGFGGLAEDDT